MAIDINDLAKEITKTVKQYTGEVVEKVEMSADELSQKGVKLLKERSPKKSGEYARGWGRVKTKGGYIIKNKKYQLTHLLEKGHAKVGGGRVPAKIHITPVEEQLIKEFVEAVEKAVKG
ncbi:HK97 gp10 family phage protein [Ureibacillus sp. FSL K6-0165]|uniref:HK97 gp10 family phage protein n=1 Tax=Ureibacillus sp. FSL K6-0165 TaxID=2954606 RepID=UPI0030F78FEF